MPASIDLPTDPAERARLHFFDIMAHGTLDDFHEIIHPDAVNREARIEPPECRGRGPAAWHATALWLRNMAPDLSWEVHEVVAEDDLIVVHCTMTGHQTGEHARYAADGNVQRVIPATNRPFSNTQTHWLRFKGGKVIEHWANRDDLAMHLQLGWLEAAGPDDRAVTAEGATTETALDRVLSMITALNAGDIEATVAHFDADILNHGRRVGLEGVRRIFEAQRLAFPDWHHELAQTVVEGSTVVTRSFLSGTHRGTLAEPMSTVMFNGALHGIEPEGRSMRIQATHIWEVGEDGQIVVHWANRDDLGMRRQLTEDR